MVERAGSTLEVAIRVGDRLDVAFSAPPGFTVLFGPSGAGKTTTLLAVAGLVRPTTGTIRLGQQALFDTSARVDARPEQRGVGLVFQSLALFPHLSALDNVAYGTRGTRADRRARALLWLERLRVAHVAARRPGTLSGGEGQRVALARALATSPRVLLLDEPFSALDDGLRAGLRDDLASLVDEMAVPVLFVTHDRRDARALARQVIAMAAGRVVRAGTVDETLERASI